MSMIVASKLTLSWVLVGLVFGGFGFWNALSKSRIPESLPKLKTGEFNIIFSDSQSKLQLSQVLGVWKNALI